MPMTRRSRCRVSSSSRLSSRLCPCCRCTPCRSNLIPFLPFFTHLSNWFRYMVVVQHQWRNRSDRNEALQRSGAFCGRAQANMYAGSIKSCARCRSSPVWLRIYIDSCFMAQSNHTISGLSVSYCLTFRHWLPVVAPSLILQTTIRYT